MHTAIPYTSSWLMFKKQSAQILTFNVETKDQWNQTLLPDKGVEWDSMAGNTGQVGRFREKKLIQKGHCKNKCHFCGGREKNGECQTLLLANFPWDVIPIDGLFLQEHM